MRTGRPKAELVLSEGERSQLQSFVRSRSLPAAQSTRARIILSSADGESNKVIAKQLGITQATVGNGVRASSSDALLVSTTTCALVHRARSTTNAWHS
ncbi:Homeodomain-like domain-containing protein [Pseudomonas borbori]|uniref:Homeodomain-like domain-containing protein n=1 Tax=Pseudomonas borbori TaxID=289003 RepID=A0A1I5WUU4_9PSED|nr:Homeodomain-like domain-containing protein [Pseudomonas borbori]